MTADDAIHRRISHNFNVLKLGAALLVLAGHFFQSIPLLWVPVTMGLVIFAFSSGLFTTIKYPAPVVIKTFWTKKAKRLGVHLLGIDLFLLGLFLVQGRASVFSWHSLVNALGLNGILNWLHIENHSPFGNGMWFFTLLMMFYLVYPGVNKIGKQWFPVFTLGCVIIAWWANRHFPYGHALYITACGFFMGLNDAKSGRFPVGSGIKGGLLVSTFVLLIVFLICRPPWLTFLIVLGLSLTLIYWTIDMVFPHCVYRVSLFFSGCLLEIYLTHTYLFVHPTGIRAIDFFFSVSVILMTAKALSLLPRFVFNHRLKMRHI